MKSDNNIKALKRELTSIISETNGINLNDTLELLSYSQTIKADNKLIDSVSEFRQLILSYQNNECNIHDLLDHPLGVAFFNFFKEFPIPYHEEHIHLTGSLDADFIYPRLKKLLEGDLKDKYEDKIKEVYGDDALPITCKEDVDKLIRLKDGEQFKTYLRILFLPKLILNTREAHIEAAYSMAKKLFTEYNVGKIRLKFTLSRATGVSTESIPGIEDITEEDVMIGLFEGFMKYKKENPAFQFVLSPSFRKESNFFDHVNFNSKQDHFLFQVEQIFKIIDKHPEIAPYVTDVDTVGDEKELYRKTHFSEMKAGFRSLQYKGFKIRSHHGETFTTLNRGVQAVDNAMNIWHIETLEHGLSLGINPNYYFHRLYQRVMEWNRESKPIPKTGQEYLEIENIEWRDIEVKDKLIAGTPLTHKEEISFIKSKFHTAREIEHYQHDVLNRMINKKVSLVSLPSSNMKLTDCFPDYKDHPFSWWEKKGVKLGIGTDNYVTLSTNYIQELLILLFSDPSNLKITKLLMVATRETRRTYLSHLLWEMRKKEEA